MADKIIPHEKILSKEQKGFLNLFQKNHAICSSFVLSGGTALAAFYLGHRYSEDLDFFTAKEFVPQDIFPTLNTFAKILRFKEIEYQQSFNRNIYFFMRDFIDLYFIMRRKKWLLSDLMKLARTKFDIHMDFIQLGSQLYKVKTLKDFPRLIKKTNIARVIDFFLKEAKKIGTKITV